jgi:trehalose 6-phosphate phosphatase
MDAKSPPQLPCPNLDWALFLDFDGTLIDIAATPDAVRVEPDLIETLDRLRVLLGGALAIVSGRPLTQIAHYLSPLELAAAGLHGLERRCAEGVVVRSDGAAAAIGVVRDQLAAFATGKPQVFLEDKDLTLALHYRGAPELEEACRDAVERAVAQAGSGVRVLDGKMVLEVKPSGVDKGIAIKGFLEEAPFAGRVPVFVGDDVTDEYGFAFVEQRGGISIRVGHTGETQARYRIGTAADMRAWLAEVAGELTKKSKSGAA